MPRIPGVDPKTVPPHLAKVLEAQAGVWGAPLANHLIYAHRPNVFRAARAMWSGLNSDGLLDEGLVALVNRRVASINKCRF